ncbi:MAG: Slp family lipoprotein [Deltaproteobacteria bacterium]|nr:Slp family lipoprotein [Deltaproteobacteria bacterium]
MIKTLSSMLLVISLIAVAGCAREIPENIISNVDTAITFSMLIKDPSGYKGKTVMTGGEVISSVNESSGTTSLEIMELPLERDYKPEKGDRSSGRFIAVYPGYLETHIFRPGRFVTVVGVVEAPQKGTIGSMPYVFPVIDTTYIKLWPIVHRSNLPAYSIGLGFDYGPSLFPPWGYYPYGPFWY